MYLFLNPTVISTINITSTCFYKQPSCQGSKNKEVKQLAKQPLIVKNANAKKIGYTQGKKFYFFSCKFTESKFLYNCFWYNLIVHNSI